MLIDEMKNTGIAYLGILIFVVSASFFMNVASVCSKEKPKELTLSSWDSEKGAAVPTWREMIKDMEKATNGKITVKMYHAQALGKAKEHYEMALNRTADFTYLNIGFTPGRFPLTDLTGFAHGSSGEILSRGIMSVMEGGYLDKEYGKVQLLYVWSTSPSHFIWGKGVKAATNLKELKGKKIRVPTTGAANLMKALGAIPVAIPMPEVYTALERGVIDATFTCINVMEIFGLHHICKEITIADGPGMAFCLMMNKKSWQELPTEAKNVLKENKRKYALMAGKNMDVIDKRCLEKYNIKVHHLTDAEKNTMKQASAKMLQEYVDKYEGLDFPARKATSAYWKCLKTEYNEEPFILPN